MKTPSNPFALSVAALACILNCTLALASTTEDDQSEAEEAIATMEAAIANIREDVAKGRTTVTASTTQNAIVIMVTAAFFLNRGTEPVREAEKFARDSQEAALRAEQQREEAARKSAAAQRAERAAMSRERLPERTNDLRDRTDRNSSDGPPDSREGIGALRQWDNERIQRESADRDEG